MRAGLTIWNHKLWYTEMKNAHKQVKNTWSEKEDMSVIISCVTWPQKQEQRSEIIRCFTELSRHRISCFFFSQALRPLFYLQDSPHALHWDLLLTKFTYDHVLFSNNELRSNCITFAGNDFYYVRCVSNLSKPATHVSDDLAVVTTETH